MNLATTRSVSWDHSITLTNPSLHINMKDQACITLKENDFDCNLNYVKNIKLKKDIRIDHYRDGYKVVVLSTITN